MNNAQTKLFGRDQRYILRQMASEQHVIRLVMYHQMQVPEKIFLHCEKELSDKQPISAKELQALGRKGVLDQEMAFQGEHVSIVKFRIKEEIKSKFLQ